MQTANEREQSSIADRERIEASLTLRAGTGADAAHIASAIVMTLHDIYTALAPVIGHRGVAALCQRSLHLASARHPWLTEMQAGEAANIDLGTLETVLCRQTAPDAAAAGVTLLHALCDLLASLVGPSLTERLLRPVWAPFSAPTQDPHS